MKGARTARFLILLTIATGCGPGPAAAPEKAPAQSPPTLVVPALQTLKVGAAEHCTSDNGVYELTLPVHWDDPARGTFRYSFQIRLAEGVDYRFAPVVVVLNGGPGSPAIHPKDARAPVGAVPRHFNAIYTDVRGTGCNAALDDGTPFPDSAYWGDFYAKDVLALIWALGLNQYFIFGVSYGTVHATLIASQAQTYGLPLPKALVLEGTFGHHITAGQWIQGWQDEWEEMKPALPARVVSALSSTPMPLGYSSSAWHLLLGQGLKMATTSRAGNPLEKLLAAWGSDDPAISSLAEQLLKTGLSAPPVEDLPRVELATWCRELFDDGVYARDFSGGRFVNVGENICQRFGFRFERPYDSAAYPLTMPIYYFQGDDDPTTTPANAHDHFINQRRTNRAYFEIGGAGHGPISATLASLGCTDAVWNAIAVFPLSLGSALQGCSWPIRTEVLLKGQ